MARPASGLSRRPSCRSSRRRFAALLAAAACVLAQSTAQATPAEDFFHGRQLTLLLGGGVGGANDTYARLLSRHIVNHLPGNPTIVPKNMPSAGGVQAYIQLGQTAPRDGSTFGTSARGPLTDPIYSDTPAPYDVRKFIWIGSMNDESTICYTRKDSTVKTLADARTNVTTVASTGALSESAKFPLALNAAIGTRFKVIAGYSGPANTHLAVERGETEGRCNTIGSILAAQPDIIAKRDINILVQIGLEKIAGLEDVPSALELADTQAKKDLLRLLVAPLGIASAFALPEGVPEDRVDVWRRAFAATLKDPQFLEEAKKVGLDVTPRTGPEVAAIVKTMYATPKSVVEEATKSLTLGR